MGHWGRPTTVSPFCLTAKLRPLPEKSIEKKERKKKRNNTCRKIRKETCYMSSDYDAGQ
jgi:hypothetical protein